MRSFGFPFRNIAFNVSGYGVSVAVTFLIAPITLHALGDTRYGAWSLISELIGYYGLLDMGFRGAITYYVARHKSLEQVQDIKETISSGFWILLALGIVVIVIGSCLAFNFQHIFKTSGLNLHEVREAFLILSTLIAIGFPMNAFYGGLVGSERFDITNGTEIISRILTGYLTFLAMKAHQGLVELAWIQAAGRVVPWALVLLASRKVIGGLFIKPSWLKKERIVELFKYGYRNAIGVVTQLVIYRMDLTVVAIFAGVGSVTYYSIGGSLVTLAASLCTSISFVFTPSFTRLNATGKSEEITKLFINGMRGVGIVAIGMSSGLLAFGHDFIRLWLGAAYVQGEWTHRSDLIMAVLVVANLPRMLQNISWQLLFGAAKIRFLMWLNICEAIANLALSILLVKSIGPIGAAFGTLFPLLISHGLVLPQYVSRVFKIPLSLMVRRGLGPATLTGIVMYGASKLFLFLLPTVSWKLFAVDVVITMFCGGLFFMRFGISGEERKEGLAKLRNVLGLFGTTNA